MKRVVLNFIHGNYFYKKFLYTELASNLKEFIRTEDPHSRDYFNMQVETVINLLSNEEDAHLLTKVKSLFKRVAIDISADFIDPKAAGSGSVILYGDAWKNNSMYRYDDQRKPIEICLLYWQIERVITNH